MNRVLTLNEDVLKEKVPAIGLLLLLWLQKVIDDRVQIVDMQTGSRGIGEHDLNRASAYLYLVKDETQVRYATPIALLLSKLWRRPAMDLAVELALRLHHISRKSKLLGGECAIEVVPPGLIHLRLSDASIATWLHRLAQNPPWVEPMSRESPESGAEVNNSDFLFPSSLLPLPYPLSPTPSSVFPIQYAHARCCSLLRLAHRERSIVLATPEIDRTPAYWSLLHPNPIPWLNADLQLRLVHPAERSLIYHLLSILDAVYCPPTKLRNSVPWEKLAVNLSQSFEKFYSQCRIWGEVKAQSPELAQARLGLILATQALLRLLLEDLLGFPAPLEL